MITMLSWCCGVKLEGPMLRLGIIIIMNVNIEGCKSLGPEQCEQCWAGDR